MIIKNEIEIFFSILFYSLLKLVLKISIWFVTISYLKSRNNRYNSRGKVNKIYIFFVNIILIYIYIFIYNK